MSIKEKLTLAAQTCQQSKTPTANTSSSSEAERKARTRRLIQIGAIADQYLNTIGLEPEAAEKLMRELVELPQVKAIIHRHRRPE